MVVYCNTCYRKAILLLAAFAGFTGFSGGALASDWREKLRRGPETGVAGPARAAADGGGAFAYSGSTRSGVTSNANQDFDPLASGYMETEQELVAKKKAGELTLGVQLRGSFEAAFSADEIEYGDAEARFSVAGRTDGGRETALTPGYRLEHDNGFRSHDSGLTLETRKARGKAVHFTTLTGNSIVHDSQSFAGVSLDHGDNDRLRLGLESGLELPSAGGVTPSVSLGLVDIAYNRETDLGGYRRDTSAVFARASAKLGGEGPLSGEAGLMAFSRRYDEPRFEDRVFLLPDASLTWKADEKTSLSFSYLADLEETPLYGASNLYSRTAAVTLTRKLDDKTAVSAVLFSERDAYLETPFKERTRGAGLEFQHVLGDGVALSAGGEFERIGGTGFPEEVDVWKVLAGFTVGLSK